MPRNDDSIHTHRGGLDETDSARSRLARNTAARRPPVVRSPSVCTIPTLHVANGPSNQQHSFTIGECKHASGVSDLLERDAAFCLWRYFCPRFPRTEICGKRRTWRSPTGSGNHCGVRSTGNGVLLSNTSIRRSNPHRTPTSVITNREHRCNNTSRKIACHGWRRSFAVPAGNFCLIALESTPLFSRRWLCRVGRSFCSQESVWSRYGVSTKYEVPNPVSIQDSARKKHSHIRRHVPLSLNFHLNLKLKHGENRKSR
jgi:hypothetical protein